jgi:RNA polymerase sigma-32 factor
MPYPSLSLSLSLSLNLLRNQNTDSYESSIKSIPFLTPERETELAKNLQEKNCLASAEELIFSHLRFVSHVARGYGGYGLEKSDLIQEGNIGLMKAVKRFNPDIGVRLVSFAVHWIKAEIHEFVLRNFRTVRIATTKAHKKLFYNLRKKKKGTNWLTNDEAKYIAEELNVAKKDVFEMESRLSGKDPSLNIADESDDQDSFTPALFIEDNQSNFSLQIEEENTTSHNNQNLKIALGQLKDRDRDIVQSRWLDEDKKTLSELANKYGISAERVRQVENNAIKNLGKIWNNIY